MQFNKRLKTRKWNREEQAQLEESVKYIKQETEQIQNRVDTINCQMDVLSSEQDKTLDVIEQMSKEKILGIRVGTRDFRRNWRRIDTEWYSFQFIIWEQMDTIRVQTDEAIILKAIPHIIMIF